MFRRLTAVVAALVAVTTSVVAFQSPANAWSQWISTSYQYYTHGGRLLINASGQGVNWGCSGGGLVMDCADARDLYASVYALDTSPNAVRVQTWTSFSGSALSVGIPPGGSGSQSGWTCYQPLYEAVGKFVSTTMNGVQCHAQTFFAITGLTVWVRGEGRWGGAYDGTVRSMFLDMYPR